MTKILLKKLILKFNGKIIVDADAISIFENQKNEFYQLIKKKIINSNSTQRRV